VQLKKDAVPAVFPRHSNCNESNSTQSSSVTVSVSNMGEQCSIRKRPRKDVVVPVEKKRMAHKKRERLRVIYVQLTAKPNN